MTASFAAALMVIVWVEFVVAVLSLAISRLSASRPRERRALTVPTGVPVRVAISSIGRSAR
ncbi:hypothetical protein ACFQX7_34930 [Luedemannella flava]